MDELIPEGAWMLDRLLAVSLRLTVTTLIAAVGGACVLSTYSGFIHLARIHVAQAAWMLGLALLCGVSAYLLAARRDDLADG